MRGRWESQEACGHSASAVGSGAMAATADQAVGDASGHDGVPDEAVLRTAGRTIGRLPTARSSRRRMRWSRSGTLLRSIDPDRERVSTPHGEYVVPDDAFPRGGVIPPSARGKWIGPGVGQGRGFRRRLTSGDASWRCEALGAGDAVMIRSSTSPALILDWRGTSVVQVRRPLSD